MSTQGTPGRFPSLPQSCQSDPASAERAVLERWKGEGTFAAVQRARAGGEPFVFWEGPPTANGRPGIHHVLARTFKDAVCRSQVMLGRRVERKAGWDTHGLPVELEVEKQLGVSGKRAIEGLEGGVAEFNRRCRESVWRYREEWERLSERIGYWLDYEHPYVTYELSYIESVWYLLARMHQSGLIFHGRRVVPYCCRCETGLSSHELGQPGVYRDVLDPSVIVRFSLEQAGDLPESFLAWTTTPWTLPSNFALAVHPEHAYVRAQLARKGEKAEIVWVVKERAEAVLGSDYQELEVVPGAELVGRVYRPLFVHPSTKDSAHSFCVRPGQFVTVEDGTGIVHQAPYGEDDFRLATAEGIDATRFESLGSDGRFRFDLGAERGSFFKEADKAIRRDLRDRGLLFADRQESHSYPHCWRCDTPLYYCPRPAWYIRTTSLKQRMVELNRSIHWIPSDVGEKRFGEWLENNVDWNISRDRYWGTPLPFWICDRCGAEEAFGGIADLQRRSGPLPNGFDGHKPLADTIAFGCLRCDGTMQRTSPVLDCWFDSGAMPYAQHGAPHVKGSRRLVEQQFPADFICEGLDQTRGWFYTLHAIGTFATTLEESGLPDGPAYKACLVVGLVLDKDGVKMSKRLGNVIDPWEVIEQHGADALRWYFIASGAPWLQKRLDPRGVFEVRQRFFDKLYNSYSFFREYARIDGFDPAGDSLPPPQARNEIDRWLVSRVQTLCAEVRERARAFDLTGAARALEAFVVDDLSNWYIRRNRRRFWKSEIGADKLAAYATLHEALRALACLIAPLAPFTSELLWERLEGPASSVHAELYPEPIEELQDEELEAAVSLVQRVVAMGRALRERAGIRVRQPLRGMHVRSSRTADLDLLGGSFARMQVLDELNIKSLASLATDDGTTVALRAKPNFRTLGPRLGKAMRGAVEGIAVLRPEQLQALRVGDSVEIEVGGEKVSISSAEVLIEVENRSSHDVETDGRLIVWLDTELDEELVLEGLAREIVNRVNTLRKNRGLSLEQRIRLRMQPQGSPELERSLSEHASMLQRETLAVELLLLDSSAREDFEVEWELGEGGTLRCSLFPI